MIRPMALAAALSLALLLPDHLAAQDAQQRVEWNRRFAPFRIVGNVYYVGTRGLSAFLITGPKGHVLIDGGLPESAPLIAANIRTLGFRLHDVKYLLINHTHYDHAGGLAELKRLTGAQLIASEAEQADLAAGKTIGRPTLAGFPVVAVDRLVRDGDQLTLGPIKLIALFTPGHTKGGISWLTTTAGKRVLFTTSLTVAGQRLVGDPAYPSAATDFAATFKRLHAVKADVFLNFHPDFFDMEAKRAAQLRGNATAFVDPAELNRQVDGAEADFRKALAAEQAARRP